MGAVYNFSPTEMLLFFLLLLRISAFVVSWPVFGAPNVPAPVKVLLALIISIIVFPVLPKSSLSVNVESMELVWVAAREVFIGVSFGFLARTFFYSLNVAGQIISVSIGLSSAEVFDPSSGSRSSAIEQLYTALATLFFLSIGGHHLFLSGLVDSFRLVPISTDMLNAQAFAKMGDVVMHVTEIGIKLAGPVMVSIFFMNISMAVIGRAVPQINVLITSLPVNVLMGFIVMIVALPLAILQMGEMLEISSYHLFNMLKSY